MAKTRSGKLTGQDKRDKLLHGIASKPAGKQTRLLHNVRAAQKKESGMIQSEIDAARLALRTGRLRAMLNDFQGYPWVHRHWWNSNYAVDNPHIVQGDDLQQLNQQKHAKHLRHVAYVKKNVEEIKEIRRMLSAQKQAKRHNDAFIVNNIAELVELGQPYAAFG